MVLLLSNTGCVLLGSDHVGGRVVIAGHCSSHTCEVLETLFLLRVIIVTAAQLRHLDLELVGRGVCDGEGQGGSVGGGGTQVQVRMEAGVGAT